MIGPGRGVRVYLACGPTDMRKGIEGLAALAQDVLRQKAAGGAVFAFRGKWGDRLKLLHWDGQGFCLYYKVLEQGVISVAYREGRSRAVVDHAASDGQDGCSALDHDAPGSCLREHRGRPLRDDP